MRQKPVMLLILDGWGYRKEITPDNAIEQGHTPNWHRCLKEYPHCLVQTSGLAVGLPEGQMGNSEVGHTNLGAGRVVMQDLPKIDLAIKDGSLKKNPVLLKLIEKLKENGKTCHLMGLMSPGGVHSSQHHIVALAGILNEHGIKTDVHAFLDGRDTPPESAAGFVAEFEKTPPPWKTSKSPPWPDVSTPWTATSAGTGWKKPTTTWLWPTANVLPTRSRRSKLLMPKKSATNSWFRP